MHPVVINTCKLEMFYNCYSKHVAVHFQPLTVTQIKKIQSLIEEASEKTKAEIKECEVERYKHLVMIGNVLHPSVPISNDEVHKINVCYYVCERERRTDRGRERENNFNLHVHSYDIICVHNTTHTCMYMYKCCIFADFVSVCVGVANKYTYDMNAT